MKIAENEKRQKVLSKFDILNLVIGSIIGWGSFVLPGKSFLPNSGVLNTAIGLGIGGVFVIVIQRAYKVMLGKNVGEGGEFSYTLDNLGRVQGFIVGWSLILCYLSMIPLNATAYVVISRKIFGNALLWGYLYSIGGYQVFFTDVVIASIPIIIFTWINARGISLSSMVQNIMIMSLVIIVTALFFVILAKSDLAYFKKNYLNISEFSFSKIAPVIAIIPFLFVGFDVVPQVSENLEFKPSKAHLITVLSIVAGIMIYNLLNIIAALSYSPSDLKSVEWAVGSSVIAKTGKLGFIFLLVALLAAVTGGINGFMLSSTKLLGAVSHKNLCPQMFSACNKKGVYINALFFICAVSLIGPWIGRNVIILIVDMASVLAAIAYSYVGFIGIKKADKKTDKFLCFVSLIIGLTFIGLLLIPGSPAQLSISSMLFLIAWSLLGFVFYVFTTRKKNIL